MHQLNGKRKPPKPLSETDIARIMRRGKDAYREILMCENSGQNAWTDLEVKIITNALLIFPRKTFRSLANSLGQRSERDCWEYARILRQRGTAACPTLEVPLSRDIAWMMEDVSDHRPTDVGDLGGDEPAAKRRRLILIDSSGPAQSLPSELCNKSPSTTHGARPRGPTGVVRPHSKEFKMLFATFSPEQNRLIIDLLNQGRTAEEIQAFMPRKGRSEIKEQAGRLYILDRLSSLTVAPLLSKDAQDQNPEQEEGSSNGKEVPRDTTVVSSDLSNALSAAIALAKRLPSFLVTAQLGRAAVETSSLKQAGLPQDLLNSLILPLPSLSPSPDPPPSPSPPLPSPPPPPQSEPSVQAPETTTISSLFNPYGTFHPPSSLFSLSPCPERQGASISSALVTTTSQTLPLPHPDDPADTSGHDKDSANVGSTALSQDQNGMMETSNHSEDDSDRREEENLRQLKQEVRGLKRKLRSRELQRLSAEHERLTQLLDADENVKTEEADKDRVDFFQGFGLLRLYCTKTGNDGLEVRGKSLRSEPGNVRLAVE